MLGNLSLFYLFRRHLNKGRFENCEIHDLITKHVLSFLQKNYKKELPVLQPTEIFFWNPDLDI